jgi:hypothetical protein
MVVVVGATVVEVVLGGSKMVVVVELGGGMGRRVGAEEAALGRSVTVRMAPSSNAPNARVLQERLRGTVVLTPILQP